MNQKEWRDSLLKILKNFGINNPKTFSIYMEALTHPSYANENGLKYCYERLEFLGDAAIQWIIVNYLYGKKPEMDVGNMSTIKSNVVKKETLANACKQINLNKLILIGKGNIISERICEDVFEAFIGAIAQDQGIKKVSQILNKTIIKSYEMNEIDISKDYKTRFQEEIQASNIFKPIYEHIDKGKQKYTKLYCVDTNGNKLLFGEGQATDFKSADKLAAKQALEKNFSKGRN